MHTNIGLAHAPMLVGRACGSKRSGTSATASVIHMGLGSALLSPAHK